MEGYVYKSSPDINKALRAMTPQGAYVASAEDCQKSCSLSIYPPCAYFDYHSSKAPLGACWFLPANATLVQKEGWTAGPANCPENATAGSSMWASTNGTAAAVAAAADLTAAEANPTTTAGLNMTPVLVGAEAAPAEASGGMPAWLPAAAILCIISALIAAAVAYFSCFKAQKKPKKKRGLKDMPKPAYTPVPDGTTEDKALLAMEAPAPMASYHPAAMPMMAPHMQMQELLPTVAAPMPMYSAAPQYGAPVQMMAAPPMMMAAQPMEPAQPVQIAQPHLMPQMQMSQPAPMAAQVASGQQIFDMLDRNHDGVISRSEFAMAVQPQTQQFLQAQPAQAVRYP